MNSQLISQPKAKEVSLDLGLVQKDLVTVQALVRDPTDQVITALIF